MGAGLQLLPVAHLLLQIHELLSTTSTIGKGPNWSTQEWPTTQQIQICGQKAITTEL